MKKGTGKRPGLPGERRIRGAWREYQKDPGCKDPEKGNGMVRVLHELATLDGGGVAKLLYDYYRNMDDRENLKFDFLIYDFLEEGIYEEPLRQMGCRIHRIPVFKRDKKASLQAMERVIREGRYDVVHSHRCTRGVFALWFARKYRVPRRLIHSHIAYEEVGRAGEAVNRVLGIINRHLATDLFACGRDAAKYMWGEKRLAAGKVHIMTNAIDTALFRFSQEIRDRMRRELGVGDRFVIGTVGRLDRQKNQTFLLDAFADLLKQERDAVLLLAGRGEDEQMLRDRCARLGIGESVRFLGIRKDIPELCSAFDLFVMPSLYEGLPVSVVEAQAAGLPVLLSETVTDEVIVTDLVTTLPLRLEAWTQAMLAAAGSRQETDRDSDRASYAEKVAQAGYDIKEESRKMQAFYLNE